MAMREEHKLLINFTISRRLISVDEMVDIVKCVPFQKKVYLFNRRYVIHIDYLLVLMAAIKFRGLDPDRILQCKLPDGGCLWEPSEMVHLLNGREE